MWWKLIDGFFYINLPHRTDRQEQIEQVLHDLGIPNSKIHRVDGLKDTIGHRGCTRAHMRALQTAQDYNCHMACILEDDFVPNVSTDMFHIELNTAWVALDQQAPDWQVLFLAQTPIHLGPSITPRCRRMLQALALPAYIIKRQYFPKMRYILRQALTENQPHDLVTQQHQTVDQWYGFYPPIGKQRPSYSDIERRLTDYQDLEVQAVMVTPTPNTGQTNCVVS